MGEPLVSVVFPAYNEESRIASALERTARFLSERDLDAEVVVVNDGSADETEQKAWGFASKDPRVRVISHSPNRGKGYAVKQGLLEARGRYRIFLDVDMASPVEDIDGLLSALQDGADMVLGSRHVPGASIEVRQPFIRQFMGSVFRTLAVTMLGLRVSDVTCGFKGLTREAAEQLCAVQREHGWAFDAELIHVAREWGLDVREVPVRWTDSGVTTVRPFAAAWRSLQELLRIWKHSRQGAYERPPAVGLE